MIKESTPTQTSGAEAPAPVKLPRERLFQISFGVGGVMLARVLGIFTQIILARRLGAEQYGLFNSLYALLNPLIILANLGLDNWLLRQSADRVKLNKSVSRVFALRGFVLAGLLLAAAPFVSMRSPEFTPHLIALACAGIIGDLLVGTADTALRASIQVLKASSLQIVVAFSLFVPIWFTPSLPFSTVVIYRCIAVALGFGLSVYYLHGILRWVWQPRQWINTISEARFYFVSEVMAYLTLRVDLFLVALLLPTINSGIYAPPLAIINNTFLVPSITAQILLPMIVKHPPRSPLYRRVISLAIGLSILYGLAWFALLTWYSDWIINLMYGPQYAAAIPLLQIMAIIPLLKSLNFCWATFMVSNDQQPLRVKLQTIGATISILGNFVVIPLYGLHGVAIINMITEIALFISYGYGAWLTYKKVMR